MIDIRPAVRTLLKLLITENIIFSDQSETRPPLPYWSIKVNSQSDKGLGSFSQGVDINGNQFIRGVREATIEVQRYGVDSELFMLDLRDNLYRESIRDAWLLAKLALFDIGEVMNIPTTLDNNAFEPRAAMDIFVRYGIKITDNVGQIDTVALLLALDTNGDGINEPDLSETVQIVLS